MSANLQNSITVKQRDVRLDILRILATFMVVMLHTSAQKWFSVPPSTFEWQVMNAYDSIVRCAVPIFFMISGGLFLGSKTLDMRKLFLHNILRLLVVYILWSAFYAVDTLGTAKVFSSLGKLFSTIVASKYHLWFLPSMIGVYIIYPVLYSLVHYEHGKFTRYFVIIFSLFGILIPTVLGIPTLGNTTNTILTKIPVELCKYSGYFVLGYYLSRLDINKIKTAVLIAVGLAAIGLCAVLTSLYSVSIGKATQLLYGYFTITTFAEAVTLYLLFRKLKQPSSPKVISRVQYISACTLGVYLVHPFVLEHLNLFFGFNTLIVNPLIGVPMVGVSAFLISILAMMLLKKIPILNKWII